ncbi:endonuclease/exonuclease/phosphatase family metal-dependent hydrolase [Lentzea flaviverrucosa]|uniref:Metal-dependent hydrolase, endonuclease/exonuclease/phosphatase family n=1 Tax=Lentzea flaviverrucosa TaxID=200379 RepID=A0A1H9XXH0_9PSEU|nr:endonuclease/exonuclease/phosphatase family metal-dependent hydrolase [Lentzea flaviverrucosa]SES50776.1 Metal-dependent hydrolase, endonuclease/exonuclease/phosphatase family [Lentzea flaviverrucosa]
MIGRVDPLSVMSFNLRYASAAEPNSWAVRRPVMAQFLLEERPALIGTQEGLYGQLNDIAHDLPDHYDWIGLGRAGGSHDEFMAIFFDTIRLEPLEFDHHWLSATPDVVGSRSWGNNVVRMVTWVRFADRQTGKQFVAVNTHFDHESANARLCGAEFVRDRLQAQTLPVVLTGDFNDVPGSPAYATLTAGLADTWLTGPQTTPAYGTFHGYGPLVPDGPRIDWILTRGVTVEAAAINTFQLNGQYPSDHLAVQALIRI